MSTRTLRQLISVIVIILTAILFIHFFQGHPIYWQQLGRVSPWTLIWVILLNVVMLIVLVLINIATLELCGKKIALKENFMVTAYSSITNFFGPLQSGPGVRAIYLRTKHGIRLRDYTLASLLTLGMFAFFSALFLLIGTRPWWQTILALGLVGGASWVILRLFRGRDTNLAKSQFVLRPNVLATLLLLTFVQVLLTIAWYYVELKAVDPGVRISQAMSYAGAANFSLFVSITPDGIGIREAFLIFSQNLHHISTATIASANLIDRAAYVVFLGLLFIVVVSTHGLSTIGLKKLRRQSAASDDQSRR